VLITCRSQFFSAGEEPFNRRGLVAVAGFVCPVVYNSLFTDEQTDEYLRRRAAERKNSEVWLASAHAIISGMGSLRMRPMLLAHVDDFLESREVRWTEYTIYKALIHAWLLREHQKITGGDHGRPAVEDLWIACRRLAIFLHSRHELRVSQEELTALVEKFPEVASVPFMHIGGRSLLNVDSQGNYRFSHFSIQEFLVVNAVVEGEMAVDSDAVRTTDFMSRLATAWLRGGGPRDIRRISAFASSLVNADFTDTDLSETDFSGMRLDGSDFSHSNLTGAKFNGSSLLGCRMEGTVLRNATFRSASLDGALLTDVDAEQAEFQWASFRDAHFTRANFRRANFNYTKLTGARYDAGTLWPANIFPADTGATLIIT
jgi:uncharacterized protein YjbI with pentapeptide repeats